MTKIEIDNKKMWETAIRLYRQITGHSVGFDKALEGMGLCYKDGEITTIEPEAKWYVALNDYGHYINITGAVPLFLKGERTTKENVFNMCKDIMGYEITEEEFNKNLRPATKEDIQKYALENPLVGEFDFPDYDKPATEEDIPLKETLVEVYQASVDSATKEPEQPKDEIPQKTKFKVGDHIKSDVLTPRKGVVTKVNNGWYILDDRYVLNFEYEDNWELVESKPEPKKCLFTKDLYTDEERKELCEGCQEECELNKDIEPEFKIEKGKWYRCIKDLNPINGSYIGLMPIMLDKIFEEGCLYHSSEDNYIRSTNGLSYSYDEIKEHFRPATEEEIAWLEAQGETSPVLSNSSNIGKVEQKPVEWSEEDLSMMGRIRSIIEKYAFSQSAVDVNGELCEKEFVDADNWLKSLKSRVQPQIKQEWSEEDEKMIECAIDIIEWYSVVDKSKSRRVSDWLKSLRPQSQWKPSDEQMLAINTAINVLGKGTLSGKQLVELYQDLKKLREE